MVCDLSNEITLIGDWDPDILFSLIQPKVPTLVYIDSLILLAPARAMAGKVPTTWLNFDDCFLDDIIKVFLDCLSIIKRNATLVLLAMHVSMRLLAKDEQVPRKETLSLNKLLLEGTPSELMIVLGWLIDTRRLLLWLPQDKFDRWRKELRNLLADPKISKIALKSLIGKLVHAAYVILISSFFIAILEPSCFNEGEVYQISLKIIQGGNRRYDAMRHPFRASA